LDQVVKTLIIRSFNIKSISATKQTLLWWVVETFTRVIPLLAVTTSLLLPTTADTTDRSLINFPPLTLLFHAIVITLSYLLLWRQKKTSVDANNKDANKIPFFSEYRFGMMLATIAAILAVDFPALFPRRLAKSETYGSSLMDLGVGSFVFSGALVSPSARGRERGSSSILKIARHNAPLLVLACARLVSVFLTGYQTHVGEYGEHWNFFMTLLVVGVTVNVLDNILVRPTAKTYALAGTAIAVLQQSLLTFGMQRYVEEAPRVNIISANKEGICSVLGYVAIYYFAVALGRVIFDTHAAALKVDSTKASQMWKTFCKKMIIIAIPLLAICYFTFTYYIDYNAKSNVDSELVPYVGYNTFSHQVPGFIAGRKDHPQVTFANIFVPSRQITNFGYVLWTVTYNIVLLTWFATLYAYVLPALDIDLQAQQSVIREALNTNQLASFLIANLLTGAINLAIKTVLWDDAFKSFGVVLIYLEVVTFIMVGFYMKRWVIKL
jgi:phosphatidylinositol glycan class W